MKGTKIKNLVSRVKSIYNTEDPIEILSMRGVDVLDINLDDDMDYFQGAYIGNENLNMVLYNKGLEYHNKKVVLWHETGHVFTKGRCNFRSITEDISSYSEARDEKEADIFTAEALIDDNTFLEYLKFYRYTEEQIANDLHIPVKYVRFKYENIDKSKLY